MSPANMSKIAIKNHYKDIKKDKHDVCAYELEDQLQISLPARILLLGPSGSGKTNLVLELIRLVGSFQRVVLLAKNLEEPLYKHLAQVFAKLETKLKTKKRIFFAIDKISDLPPIDAFSETENNLLIVDDMICESEKELKKVDEFWIRGRKNKITMCFLSQDYVSTPKKIRRNSNYVIIKKLSTDRDLKLILSDFQLGLTKQEIMAMYRKSVETGNFEDFFMIDLTSKADQDRSLRFRSNFEPIQ